MSPPPLPRCREGILRPVSAACLELGWEAQAGRPGLCSQDPAIRILHRCTQTARARLSPCLEPKGKRFPCLRAAHPHALLLWPLGWSSQAQLHSESWPPLSIALPPGIGGLVARTTGQSACPQLLPLLGSLPVAAAVFAPGRGIRAGCFWKHQHKRLRAAPAAALARESGVIPASAAWLPAALSAASVRRDLSGAGGSLHRGMVDRPGPGGLQPGLMPRAEVPWQVSWQLGHQGQGQQTVPGL